MSKELKALCSMLRSGDAELACAAAKVLGELRPDDPEVLSAFGKGLDTENQTVRQYFIDALTKLGSIEVAGYLLPLTTSPEPVRRRAIQGIASLGHQAIRVLQREYKKQSAAVKTAILEVYAAIGGKSGYEALIECLNDTDAEVHRQITSVLKAAIDRMADEERRTLTDRVLSFLGSAGAKEDPARAVSGVRLLGFLRDARAKAPLLDRLDGKVPAAIRQQALIALGQLDLNRIADNRVLQKLLGMLDEEDYANVVAHAVTALSRIDIPSRLAPSLTRLLDSRYLGVRLFAMRTLGRLGVGRVGPKLLALLTDPDPRVVEEAGAALRAHKVFARDLVRELVKTKDLSRAWTLAGILKAHRDAVPAPTLKSFLNTGLKLFDQGDDRHRLYFEIVKNAKPELLQKTLLQRGRAFKKRKKFDLAERTLALLNVEELSTLDVKFDLGIVRLKLQKRDAAAAHASTSAAFSEAHSPLTLLSYVLRSERFPIATRLKAEAGILDPSDFLYLGFHFAERTPVERAFAGEVLRYLVKRWPNSKEARIAKHKMKTEGVGG
ncbi:MAG: HEAT repeat domain-containing protein [Planctomycetes bacterium]|nr:HEAT repeat domain-containing protein [Planctomycetota bacterium]